MGAAPVPQSDVDTRHLQQCLCRYDRQHVGEQRTETGGPRQVTASLRQIALTKGDKGGPSVHQGTGPVVLELPFLNDRDGLLCQRHCCQPVVVPLGDDAALRQDERRQGGGTDPDRIVKGIGQNRIGSIKIVF